MDRDRQVCWNCPRGGSPDRDRSLSRKRSALNRKLDIDRRICSVLVFDFGFCQRGLGAGAPKDRLFALINQDLFPLIPQRREERRPRRRVKRQVGMFPISEDAEPSKLTSLNIDVFAGISLGSLTHIERRKSFGFFNDFELDRQSMTIPTRDIRAL